MDLRPMDIVLLHGYEPPLAQLFIIVVVIITAVTIDRCWCIFVMLRLGLRLIPISPNIHLLRYTIQYLGLSTYCLSIRAVPRSAAFWSNSMLTVVQLSSGFSPGFLGDHL